MAKTTYASLKLKPNTETREVEVKVGEEIKKINVKQYLNFNSKVDLLEVTLQKSLENTKYNPIVLDMYFHLHLVYMYTDLEFTAKQREDEAKIYDAIRSTGLLDKIIDAIPEEEYEELYNFLVELVEIKSEENSSISGVIAKIINELPAQADKVNEIIENFDPEKFQEVINFAKAANGNRPL